MNCLTHLLDLISRGHKFSILYDGNHCIGVNETKLFDFGNFLKKDFLNRNKINFTPIEEWHSKETIAKIFSLTELEKEILYDYYRTI